MSKFKGSTVSSCTVSNDGMSYMPPGTGLNLAAHACHGAYGHAHSSFFPTHEAAHVVKNPIRYIGGDMKL